MRRFYCNSTLNNSVGMSLRALYAVGELLIVARLRDLRCNLFIGWRHYA